MNLFESAQKLARMGFYVFPVKENKKLPAVADFTGSATCDAEDLKKFWVDPVMGWIIPHNIGIATTHYKSGGLLVVDIDNRGSKAGTKTVLRLEMEGKVLPPTLTSVTASGGFHYFYSIKKAIKQGAELYGKNSGFDTRSRGGLVVAPGSQIDGTTYHFQDDTVPIVEAPEWLVKKCSEGVTQERKALKKSTMKISQKGAMSRGRDYLLNTAPIAVEGAAGDHTTFVVASKLKDLGVSELNCLELMLDNWNDNCQPPWAPEQLKVKVENAYAYGQNKAGVDSPESDFGPTTPNTSGSPNAAFNASDEKGILEIEEDEDGVLDPIEELNKEFAYAILGGKSTIIQKNPNKKEIQYIGVQTFHDFLKPRTIQTGNGRKKQLSEMWFQSPKRPTYRKIEFAPGQKVGKETYNLWQGLDIEPLSKNEVATPEMIEGVAMFKEHGLLNICAEDKKLFHWLMGFFAHMVQKPFEKPLVALVLKGAKGVGKNEFVDRIGELVETHYKGAAQRRYLTSNFNAHFQATLLHVFDEVSWAGDKEAEGVLKDLITGKVMLVEHKGKEVYKCNNYMRVVLTSNDDWVVPASVEERRYAIFNVGTGRQKDGKFFKRIRELLVDGGGNRLLLRELLDFDLSTVDVSTAPETLGLLEQKIESLNPVASWWLSSLREGTILGLEFQEEDWPTHVGKQGLRDAFTKSTKARGVRSWLPDASVFGREFSKVCPGAKSQRPRGQGARGRGYGMPTLAQCRDQFSGFIGHDMEWEDELPNNVVDAKHLFS